MSYFDIQEYLAIVEKVPKYVAVCKHRCKADLNKYNARHTYHMAFFFSMAQQPLMGQALLIIEVSQSHSNTTHCR
jgi:hypothetical protein